MKTGIRYKTNWRFLQTTLSRDCKSLNS